jgi:uncharacterized membrane protein YfcA
MTGVGGGALMTPILVLLFGVAPAAAVGTDPVVRRPDQDGRRHRPSAPRRRRLAGVSPPRARQPAGRRATLWWLHATGASQIKSGFLLHALGAVLILTRVAMLVPPAHPRLRPLPARVDARPVQARASRLLTVLAGATLGLLVTLTSVGAGALGTVMLLYLYPLRMTPARLVGTDIVHAIPLTLLAGAGHLAMGNVDFRLLGFLLLGSVPRRPARLAAQCPGAAVLLRGAISTVLVAVASKLAALLTAPLNYGSASWPSTISSSSSWTAAGTTR